MISKVCLCAQVDIAQLVKASMWLTKPERWFTSFKSKAHKDVIRATTWIVDEAETGESAAEVCGLNTTATRLYSTSVLKTK